MDKKRSVTQKTLLLICINAAPNEAFLKNIPGFAITQKNLQKNLQSGAEVDIIREIQA
jgi:hypothetical protein